MAICNHPKNKAGVHMVAVDGANGPCCFYCGLPYVRGWNLSLTERKIEAVKEEIRVILLPGSAYQPDVLARKEAEVEQLKTKLEIESVKEELKFMYLYPAAHPLKIVRKEKELEELEENLSKETRK